MNSSSCWHAALGSPISPVDGRSYAPSKQQCRSAVLGLGMQPPERLQNLLRVSVAVLGGSISCGSYVPNGIARRRITRAMVGATSKSLRGGGFENAWPAALQILLAARWGLPVTVHNLCERARGSDHWSATVASSSASGGANATSRSFAHLLNGADVVIVEAASNDMADYTTAGREADSATSFTELLAHQLLALPQQPWLLWLTAGWLHFELGRADSAESQQRRVTRHLELAHVSVPRGLVPAPSTAEARYFTTKIYFQDCCHPSIIGHKLVAAIVAEALVWSLERRPRIVYRATTDRARQQAYLTPLAAKLVPLLLGDRGEQATAAQHKLDFARVASFNGSLLHLRGFDHVEYAPGKRGLLSTGTVGDTVLIPLSDAVRLVILSFLHSYHHAGRVVVRILQLSTRASTVELTHPQSFATRGGCNVGVWHGTPCGQLNLRTLSEAEAATAECDNQSLHVTGAEHRRVGWPLHGNARTLACRKLDLLWTPTITVPRAEFIVMPARANTSTLAPKALRRGRYNTQTAACTWLSLVVVRPRHLGLARVVLQDVTTL
jgi:hypothetical protein